MHSLSYKGNANEVDGILVRLKLITLFYLIDVDGGDILID